VGFFNTPFSFTLSDDLADCFKKNSKGKHKCLHSKISLITSYNVTPLAGWQLACGISIPEASEGPATDLA
jgi:hypothetical protein